MATVSNFIPLNRKVFKHELWLEKRPYSRFEAWLDLLATARFDTTEGRVVIAGTMVRCTRGQLVASLRYLAQRWGWGKTKVDNFLKLLKHEGMVNIETADKTVQAIITICNYETYNMVKETLGQLPGQPQDTDETATRQSQDKTNKVNTEQKSKYREIYRAFAHLVLYHDEYLQLTTMGHSPTQVDDVLDAIENYKNNKKYTSLFFTAKKWLRGPGVVAGAGSGGSSSSAGGGGRINSIANAFQAALNR